MTDPLLASVLETIRRRSSTALAQGVELLGVVGSVARGEAGPESDVDIAYGIVGRPSLFEVGSILMDLQDELGRRVDMVNIARVRPALRIAIERDLVRI